MTRSQTDPAAGMDYEHVAYSFSRIGIALTSEHQLDALFRLIVDEIIAFAGCDGCSLYVRQEEPERLIFQATRTLSREKDALPTPFRPMPLRLTPGSIAGYTALTGSVVNLPDCYAIPDAVPYRHNNRYDLDTGYRTVSILSVPMRDGDGKVTGVIQLINKLDDQGRVVAFPPGIEPVIAAIASQAAVAVRSAQLQKLQVESSFVFNSLLLSLCAYSFFLAIVRTSGESFLGLSMKELVTLGFSLVFSVISVLIIRKTALPLTFFGLTRKRLSRSVGESLLATLLVVAATTGLKVYGIQHWEVFRGVPVVDWSLVGVSYFTYALIAPIQEFIRSGVLQSSLERNLASQKHHTFGAVVISSCVFGSFHIFYSVGMALLTVFSGFLWGYLYSRHRNIVGISLSHFLIGNYIALLGFWKILADL